MKSDEKQILFSFLMAPNEFELKQFFLFCK